MTPMTLNREVKRIHARWVEDVRAGHLISVASVGS